MKFLSKLKLTVMLKLRLFKTRSRPYQRPQVNIGQSQHSRRWDDQERQMHSAVSNRGVPKNFRYAVLAMLVLWALGFFLPSPAGLLLGIGSLAIFGVYLMKNRGRRRG